MTRDDIIRMAREAGFKSNAFAAVMAIRSDGRWIGVLDEVTRFAELVAVAERERCAHAAHEAWIREPDESPMVVIRVLGVKP